MSTVSSTGTLSVASGFIAARTTSSSPVDMPPSMPPASVVSRRYAAAVGIPADRVVGLAPPPPGDLEAVADLDTLDGLDAEHGLGQQGVELAIPVDVAAETDRDALGEHLDDATERVAVLGRRLDLEDHRLGRRRVEAAHRGVVDLRQVGERGRGWRWSGPGPAG